MTLHEITTTSLPDESRSKDNCKYVKKDYEPKSKICENDIDYDIGQLFV